MESHRDEDFAVEASGEEDLIEEEEEDEEVPSPAKKPRVELERAVSDPGTFKPHRRGKKVSAKKHRYDFFMGFYVIKLMNFMKASILNKNYSFSL